MTLALRLSEKGFKVTLFEAAAYPGGLASPTEIGDYTWDQFYHVILLSDSNLLQLLQELNLTEQIHWRQTKTGFYTDGHLYSMSNVIEFLSFPPLSLADKLRLGMTIFYASKIKSGKRLEEISVKDWLIRLSGKQTFNKVWLPLLKSKLGENYRIASASFIWAIIARMYAARQPGLKKEMFGYVTGGYKIILNRLQRFLDDAGVQTLCRTRVCRVTDDGIRVQVKTSKDKAYEFDALIVTVPCDQIPDLCPELSTDEKKRLQRVTYNGVISLAVLTKKPLAGYYITNITDKWVPFTGVIEMTALVNRKYFGGNSLIYLPRYLNKEDYFREKSNAKVREEFLAALQSMYPSFQKDEVVAFKITRASHVLPVTTVNYSAELLPPTKTSLEHVFVVNSAQIPNGTMNVNEIISLANKKTSEIYSIIGS